MNSSKNHVCFVVTGFNDNPAIITALMGIPPNRSWRRGDDIPGHANAKQTHDRWELKSSLALTEPVDLHLAGLLTELEPRADAIRATLTRFQGGISIASYYQDHNPGFILTSQLLKRTSDLHLSIDFDLYFLGDAQ